jgi:beta-galactosidase
MSRSASLEQVYGDVTESENLLPFNDLNMEFGYVLYQAEIKVKPEETLLELENVRDYAVVYLNDKLQGTVTDDHKKLTLNISPGTYTLKLYAENIGRITYGPEILDNSRGLFGSININGAEIENWTIIPLGIKSCDVNSLQFSSQNTNGAPSFHKGYFDITEPEETYLNISGWGMGEVWINGAYLGSYWEEEKQQSIQIPANILVKGKNEVVIFDLKNNKQELLRLSGKPLFK